MSGLKIDGSFTAGLGEAGVRGRVAPTVVRLGLDLGVLVVAEGVETEQQHDALSGLGCRFAQGDLFSRPVNEDEIAALLLGQPDGPASATAPLG